MKKLLMSLLSIGMLSAVVSCSDDDNDTPTTPTSEYSNYKNWNDYVNAQTPEKYENISYKFTEHPVDISFNSDVLPKLEKLVIYVYTPSYNVSGYDNLYCKIDFSEGIYSIQKDGVILNGNLQNKLPVSSTHIVDACRLPVDGGCYIKIVGYDADTNTFYQGTLDNVTYPVNTVVVLKVNLTKKN